jgi:hypothetical protein
MDMRKISIVVLALCGIAGCTTAEQSGEQRAKASLADHAQERQAYLECNIRNAHRFARQFGDAFSLALAAEARCSMELATLTEAIARTVPLRLRSKIVDIARDGAVEMNLAAIAEERAR